eukprot:3481485-Rhodomonas_salina.1
MFNAPSLTALSVSNGATVGSQQLAISGSNFGVSEVGWDYDTCLKERNVDVPDPTDCAAGDAHIVGVGPTSGIKVSEPRRMTDPND